MQNKTQIALGVAAILLLLIVALEGRYYMRTVAPGYAYVLDRWTGNVAFIAGRNRYESTPRFIDSDEVKSKLDVRSPMSPASAPNIFDQFDPPKK